MSKTEAKGSGQNPEGIPSRWRRRLKRLRNEAGLYLVRGAATAVGGTVITYGAFWVQTRA